MNPDILQEAVEKHAHLAIWIALLALVVGAGAGWLVGMGLRLLDGAAPTARAVLRLVPVRTAALAVAAYSLVLLYFDVDLLESLGVEKGADREDAIYRAALGGMLPVAFVLAASRAGRARRDTWRLQSFASMARDVLFVLALLATWVDATQGYGGLGSLARTMHVQTFDVKEAREAVYAIPWLYLRLDLGLGAVALGVGLFTQRSAKE